MLYCASGGETARDGGKASPGGRGGGPPSGAQGSTKKHMNLSHGGPKRGGLVKMFKEINEVLSDLEKMEDKSLGQAISKTFPQVFVYGAQSCGKSLLLNAMIDLKLFPSDTFQCTVCPTFFIREYCEKAVRCTATVSWKEMETAEDGTLRLKPAEDTLKEFNLDDHVGQPQLYDLMQRLQSIERVMELLRDSSNLSSHASTAANQDRFNLMKWGDTAISISVKVPMDRRGSNPVEFLQFVDLPGLQVADPAGEAAGNYDYKQLVIPRKMVTEILANARDRESGVFQEWFTAPWFSFLTAQFLKKPSALGIHCISSQAAVIGNIRSVVLMAELKKKALMLSKTVEVWTKVDFHCPRLLEGRHANQWVTNFRSRQQSLFQNILTSHFFVGALHPDGDRNRDYPLMYKCLREGMGETTKEELHAEGSQIALLLLEHEEHGVLQRLGPFALLEKCVQFMDEGLSPAFVDNIKRDLNDTSMKLQAYIDKIGRIYPMSRHGESQAHLIDQWMNQVHNAILVFLCANQNIPGVPSPQVNRGVDWVKKVAEFQENNMKHCLRKSSENSRPAFLKSANLFCPQMDFLAGTFPEFSLSEGLLQCVPQRFPESSDHDSNVACKTPLQSMMDSVNSDNAGFQNMLSIESTAHKTVKLMLARLAKDMDLGILKRSQEVQQTDSISDNWWYSCQRSFEKLIEQTCKSLMKNVSHYMIAGQFYRERQLDPEPLYGEKSYQELFKIAEHNLIEHVKKGWKGSLIDEILTIDRVSKAEASRQLTVNQDVLRRIVCLAPHVNLEPEIVATRFEIVVQSIVGILSSWDEQDSSEGTRAQLSIDPTRSIDSDQVFALPNFSPLCSSYQKEDVSCDILNAFGAKVVDPDTDDEAARSIRDLFHKLLGAAAKSDVESSLWQPVPRFQQLFQQLAARIHGFDGVVLSGRAMPGKKLALPSIVITVQRPSFHHIIPSQHYDESSLRWCLKVSYEDWIPQIPAQVIFRSLDDLRQLWSEMKKHGNIDCSSDSLPQNNSFLGQHRYHHLEFMTSCHSKLQRQLNDISEAVMRMSNEACKQAFIKWLKFNNSTELNSDREILRFKQSQFSGAVGSFLQETQSCTLRNAVEALEVMKKTDSFGFVLNPFIDAVGEVQALKTQIGRRNLERQFLGHEEIFKHYSVMTTLQGWRQDNRRSHDEFMKKISSKFIRVPGDRSSRNFKLEAQLIVSIELAQSFMQSICLRMYQASFSSIQSQLGEAGVVGTLRDVEKAVRDYLEQLQRQIEAGRYNEVIKLHPDFACPIDTEEDMRVAAKVIAKLREMFP